MLVSVITIVYNNEANIEDCIQSVLSQSYTQIEHIIIDGGSTDGTKEIIEAYRSKLGYYVSEKDDSLYDALNKGIKHATGDIIGILHSDDLYYETDTIQKIVTAFKSNNADLVYANGQYVSKSDTSKVKRIYTSKPYKPSYLKLGWIPLHTTIYVKKAVFDNYGLYNTNFRIASDYEISLRWFTNVKINTHFLNSWVVKMRLGGKSTTAKLQKFKSAEDYKIIQQYQLCGYFTLACKIIRKIPQYLLPRFIKFN